MTRPCGWLFVLVGLGLLLQGGESSQGLPQEDGLVRFRLEDGRFTYKTDSTEQISDDRNEEKRRVEVSDNLDMWYVWDGTSNIVERESLTSGGVTRAEKIEAFAATVIAIATAIFCNYGTKLFIQYQNQSQH